MSDAPDGWAEELRSNRAEKDEFLAEHDQSPIPPGEREGFEGLDYFPPGAEYRVEATVTTHDDPEIVHMETSDGREMRYERVVTFEFTLDGEVLELHGYRQPEDGPTDAPIFVPFRDKTTGQQTYHDGRYMELAPRRELEDGDEVTIDFNLAYSPFCAYNETFSCPLPEPENWLEVAIEAGEKSPR